MPCYGPKVGSQGPDSTKKRSHLPYQRGELGLLLYTWSRVLPKRGIFYESV